MIHSKKLFVVALNSLNYIPEKFINVRTICHPKRIILDFQNLNESSTSIIAPISSMSQKLRNYLNSENKFIFDFGLHINGKKKIAIYKNYCSLPKPLVLLLTFNCNIS